MLSELERIRAARFDISNWVIHWTDAGTNPLERLQHILQCGYLRASLAERFVPKYPSSVLVESRPTIRGPHPAVCFTEQQLLAFVQSWKSTPNRYPPRYQPYGIGFRKHDLFRYGGRPVIYGDEELLGRLSEADKYLWVHYSPIPIFGYPVDWTHEREWRTRVKSYDHPDWGKTPDEGVPLVLPPDRVNNEWIVSLPIILVKSLQEAIQLHKWITGLPAYEGTNCFIKELYNHFAQINIIPLEFVLERIKAGGVNQFNWFKLETLLMNEIPLCSDTSSGTEDIVSG